MKNFNKELLIGIGPNSNLIRDYKNSLFSLSTVQWECSIGLILGDANLRTQNKGKTFKIQFE